MAKYWVYRDEEVQGPFTSDQIYQLDNFSRYMYCIVGEEEWKSIDEIAELEANASESEPSDSGTESSEPLIETTRRNVTVLFADLSGFTRMTEELGDDLVYETMNRIFDELVPIIEKYGGKIDQYIGDEVLALFGADRAHEDDPERAVRSALAMFEHIRNFNDQSDLDVELGLHAGINTGTVITKKDIDVQEETFSVTGQAVDVARSLTDAAGRNFILVGPDTRDRLRGRFQLKQVPEVDVSFKNEQLPAYKVIGEKTFESDRESSTENSTRQLPFSSRQQELEQLSQLLDDDNQSFTAGIVSGSGGAGKSRFVAEFCDRMLPSDYEIYSIKSNPYSEDFPFTTLLPLFDEFFNFETPSDRPTEPGELERLPMVQANWLNTLKVLYGLSDQMEELEETGSDRSEDQDALDEVSEELAEILVELLSKKGLVFLDDAQWADRYTLSVLNSLNQLIKQLNPARKNLRILLISRPSGIREMEEEARSIADNVTHTEMHLETAPGSDGAPVFEEFMNFDPDLIHVELSPLDRGEIRDLVTRTFPGADIPEGLLDLLMKRTGGLPIHVEQVLWSLIDSGVFKIRESNDWELVEDLNYVELPATLRDLIVSRIDRLNEENYDTLLVASVLGDEFESWLLRSILDWSENQLDAELSELLERGFLRKREDEIVFQHAIIQEIAYDLLIDSDRRELHEKAARILKERLPMSDTTTLERLSVHYRGAEDVTSLMKIHIRAAERALDNRFLAKTERFLFQIKSESPEDLEVRFQARYQKAFGRLFHYRRKLDQARIHYEQALELQRELDNQRGMAVQLWSLGKLCQEQNDLQQAERRHREVLDISGDLNDDHLKALALWGLARVSERQYDWEQAEEFNKRALKLDRKTNNKKGEVVRLGSLGVVAERQGNIKQSIEYHKQALEMVRRLGDVQGQAFHLGTLGRLAEKQDRLDEAREFVSEALEFEDEIDNPRGVIIQYHTLGRIEEKLNNYEKAEKHVRRALDLERDHPNRKDRKILYGALGRITASRGNYEEALEAHHSALELEEADNNTEGMLYHYGEMAEVAEELGHYEEAGQYTDKALELSREVSGSDKIEHRRLGKMQLQTGRFIGALESFHTALKGKRRRTDRFGEAIILSQIGKTYGTMGFRNRGIEFYEKALEINREIENKTGRTICHSELSSLYEKNRQFEQAFSHGKTACELNREQANEWGQAIQLAGMMICQAELERYDKVQEFYEVARSLAKSVDQPPVFFTVYLAGARVQAHSGNEDGFEQFLEESRSIKGLSEACLETNLEPNRVTFSRSGCRLVLEHARGRQKLGDNRIAVQMLESLREIAIQNQSGKWFELLYEIVEIQARIEGTEPPEPPEFLNSYYDITMDNLPEIDPEGISPEEPQGVEDEELDPDELTVENSVFRTEFKPDEQYGPSILVLVDADDSEVETLQERLPYKMSSTFDSQYDDRYQFGFFVQNPDMSVISRLRDQTEQIL